MPATPPALLLSAESLREADDMTDALRRELLARAKARTIADGRTLVTAADVQAVVREALDAVCCDCADET